MGVRTAGRRGAGVPAGRGAHQKLTCGASKRRTAMETGWKAGLEDVIAARSGICQVDGERGKLYYRGYEIAEVAGVLSFEDVTALLWQGGVPSAAESAAFAARLEAARGLPPAVG